MLGVANAGWFCNASQLWRADLGFTEILFTHTDIYIYSYIYRYTYTDTHRITYRYEFKVNMDSSLIHIPIISKEKLLGGPSQISRNLAPWIAKQLQLEVGCVAGAVQLFQEGSTLPFIARQLGDFGPNKKKTLPRKVSPR
jgi:hypothetical protein